MYKRRLKILLGLIVAAFLVMLGRLGQLQILQGDDYRRQAEQRLRSFTFPQGQRGRILDRNGVILAEDVACHDFCLDYRFLISDPRWVKRQVRAIAKAQNLDPDKDQDNAKARRIYEQRAEYTRRLTQQLAVEFDQDLQKNIARIIRKIGRWRKAAGRDVKEQRIPHAVVNGLTEETVNSLRALMSKTVGASLVPGHYRRYPQGHVACHIIGVIGAVFRAEEERWNIPPDSADWITRMRRNYLPGDIIGKMGIEKMAERLLRPRRGIQRFKHPGEVDFEEAAQDGRDIHLTIDIELQRRVTERMRRSGYNGSFVLLSVPSGDVLAMVSCPTYDLNTYRKKYNDLAGISRDPDNPENLSATAQWSRINLPLLNRAVGGAYPTGSTVKPITALGGLGAGKITPNSIITCTGFYRTIDSKPRFRCWIYKLPQRTHPPLDLVGGLKNSCNIYFFEVGNRLGGRVLTDWLKLAGFGELAGTGLPEERTGVVATEEYLHRHENRGFFPSDAWLIAIGQGIFSATPLQIAGAHATIARGGVFLSPRVSLEGAPPQVRRNLPVPEGYVRKIRDGMYAVVNEPGGTAFKHWRNARPRLDVRVCGKTGTAETSPQRIDSDGDGRRDKIVRKGDHAWFAGFAPYKKPQIAFAVIAEYAGSGGKNAVPIAKDVLRICRELGYLKSE